MTKWGRRMIGGETKERVRGTECDSNSMSGPVSGQRFSDHTQKAVIKPTSTILPATRQGLTVNNARYTSQ